MEPSDTQLILAFEQAPQAIQDSLSDGKAIEFMVSLTTRYGFHVDTAGYISEFIRNMLLGFLGPEQFVGKLLSVGLTDTQARKLTADLNKEVFLPLRNQIRGSGASGPISHVPIMHVVKETPSTKATEESLPSETPSFNLIGQVRERATSTPVLPTPALPEATAPVPTMRTMQHDMELVQHGSMPAPYPVAAPQVHPAQATPARTFQTASVPVNVPTDRPQPTPEIVHIVPDVAPQLIPPVSQTTSSKEYTSDPYRETI